MKLKTRTRYMLVGSDFSAQQPRLTAFMSQSPQMMQAYFEGKDLYAVIAQSMFNNQYWENLQFYPEGHKIELDGKEIICGKKTHLHKAGKERRSAAKVMLLAILYGMSPATAGARMGKTAEEGQELMDNFFAQFPDVKKLMQDSMQTLLKTGYVEDWAGRRRHLPEIALPNYQIHGLKDSKQTNLNPFLCCQDRATSLSADTIQKWKRLINEKVAASQETQKRKNGKFKENGEMSNKAFEELSKTAYADGVLLVANTGKKAQASRQCLNARIQGGAASLTKLAMINVENDQLLRELDAHLVITVHDEVLVECPMAYADQVQKRLPQVMIDTAKPFINVPMACDPYAERKWYIGEYSVSIQAQFKKLEEKGYSKEEAISRVISNHPEMTEDAIRYTIQTGEEIDVDKFPLPDSIQDAIIQDLTTEEDESESSQEESKKIPFNTLFTF